MPFDNNDLNLLKSILTHDNHGLKLLLDHELNIYTAKQNNDETQLALLLKKAPQRDFNHSDDDGNSLLHHAFLAKNHEAARMLSTLSLELLAEFQFKTLDAFLKDAPSEDKEADVLRIFFKRPDVEKVRGLKKTWLPMMFASFFKRTDLVRLLDAFKFDDFLPREAQQTALSLALKNNQYSIARYLIAQGLSNPNQRFTIEGVRIHFLFNLISFQVSPKALTVLLQNNVELTLPHLFEALLFIKSNKLKNASSQNQIEKRFNQYFQLIFKALRQRIIQLTAESHLLERELTQASDRKSALLTAQSNKPPGTDADTEIRQIQEKIVQSTPLLKDILGQIKTLYRQYEQSAKVLNRSVISLEQFMTKADQQLTRIQDSIVYLSEFRVSNCLMFSARGPLKSIVEYLEEGQSQKLQLHYYQQLICPTPKFSCTSDGVDLIKPR